MTNSRIIYYDSYGFRINRDEQTKTDYHHFPEVIEGILYGEAEYENGKVKTKKDQSGREQIVWQRKPDFPPEEFYMGGVIVKQFEAAHRAAVAEWESQEKKEDERPKRPKTQIPLSTTQTLGSRSRPSLPKLHFRPISLEVERDRPRLVVYPFHDGLVAVHFGLS